MIEEIAAYIHNPLSVKSNRCRFTQGSEFAVGSTFGLRSKFELPLVPPLAVKSPLYFPPIISYFASMTANWFGATYYFGFIGYSRWGPRSRVR